MLNRFYSIIWTVITNYKYPLLKISMRQLKANSVKGIVSFVFVAAGIFESKTIGAGQARALH